MIKSMWIKPGLKLISYVDVFLACGDLLKKVNLYKKTINLFSWQL